MLIQLIFNHLKQINPFIWSIRYFRWCFNTEYSWVLYSRNPFFMVLFFCMGCGWQIFGTESKASNLFPQKLPQMQRTPYHWIGNVCHIGKIISHFIMLDGCVLCHINPCGLFEAKSCVYIYIYIYIYICVCDFFFSE